MTEMLEQGFRSLVENAAVAITIIDLKGRLMYVNTAFASLLGYSVQELQGRPIKELLHPDERTEMNLRKLIDEEDFKEIRMQTEIRKREKLSPYEVVMCRKDGKPRNFQVSASPIFEEDGSFAGTLGIVMDVTEQKKTEKALRENQQKFERLFKSIPEATVFVDSNDRILDVNPCFSKLFGYSLNEARGRLLDDLIVPKDKQKEARMLTEKSSEEYVYFDTVRKSKDGSVISVAISAAPMMSEGKHLGDIILYKDITERKQMEEAIRKSEGKFRNIFENANDGLIFLDGTGKILEVNKKAAEEFGGRKEELLGKHFTKVGIFSFRDIPKLLNAFANILAGKTSRLEIEITNRKGRKTNLECASSITRVNGKLEGILIIARDITEKKLMQKKLEEYSRQLEELVEKRTRQLKEAQEKLIKNERLAAIGQVASMVGHDLRNPLTGIAGAIYYLKRKLDSKMDETTKEMLELVEENIEYSNHIITDLLEYSKEIKLELTWSTPRSIIEEALILLKFPGNIQVLNVAQDKPKIKIDTEKMKRVFVNIIKNAIDAMQTSGGRLTITSQERDGNVEIAISDTGTGMSKDILEKIWTPFFTTKAIGMGLGLPICKRIIEAHEGKISVETIVNKGTTFTVAIPIEAEGGEKIWVKPPESSLWTTTKA